VPLARHAEGDPPIPATHVVDKEQPS